MDNPQEVHELLMKHGLAEKADALMALVRPSVRVLARRADDTKIQVGVSKIGGEPDLPPGFEWPMWEHEPPDYFAKYDLPIPQKVRALGFLAQFNLSEVASYDVEHVLPSSGMLYFFYDCVEQPPAALMGSGVKIIYYPGVEVRRTDAPPNLPPYSQFKSCRVKLKSELTFPPLYYSPYVECPHYDRIHYPDAVQLTKREGRGYQVVERIVLKGSTSRRVTMHRLLGHPQPIQGDIEGECEREVSGIRSLQDLNEKWPEARKNVRRWRLLLQLDTDNYHSNMVCGDAGKLYFCLPEAALVAQRFEEAVVIEQCT